MPDRLSGTPPRHRAIHWFRRDLRITDNPSLLAAAGHGLPVIPVFILSEWNRGHAWTGPNRQHFLCGCLESLEKNLATIGGRLILRRGNAVEQLRLLIRETNAAAVHFNASPDPYGKAVERQIRELCAESGISCRAHEDAALHGPEEVLTKTGQPYRVYTPFSNNWLSLEKPAPLPKPGNLATPPDVRSLPLPTVKSWGLEAPEMVIVPPGERAARERLKHAIHAGIPAYAENRDFPGQASGTSRISQDLRFGLVSIRTVFAAVMKARGNAPPAARKSCDVFIKELAWREFYFAILHHFPNVLDEEFNPDWRGLPWDEPGATFEAWREGRTGFPIVDAGMRQLKATGFMHNRARMITAMFLTKDLHVHWRLGESWFMRQLVDGEIASNNGGWQWCAGTGADAAPYFRIQNPWSQTARHDPGGHYIKRWIPELSATDPALFQTPPKDGKPIAAGYPAPCVDHQTERNRTLAIFKRHREQAR